MIIVTRQNNEITVEGHARAGKYGFDAICGGVSTLIWTLIESVDALTPNTPIAHVESGYANIKIGSPTEKTKLLIDFFFAGISFLADEHPEYVRVDDKR